MTNFDVCALTSYKTYKTPPVLEKFRAEEEDSSKDDLVHVLEQTDYVEYNDNESNCTTTSKSKKCKDYFKDQHDGDFYDYDTWTTEPPPDPAAPPGMS